MIWLIPPSLTVLLWLWLWLRRDPTLDFDDFVSVEIAALGTLAIWFCFAAYYLAVLA